MGVHPRAGLWICKSTVNQVKLQKIKGDLEKISVNRLYEDCDVKLDIPETAMAGTYMHILAPYPLGDSYF